MRRSGDRILVNASSRSEEPGYKIILAGFRRRGNHNASRLELAECIEIRSEASYDGLGGDVHEIVKAFSYVEWLLSYAECCEHTFGLIAGNEIGFREIEGD